MKYTILNFSVGALLYSPANNKSIVESLIQGKFEPPFSLALCLEDTIQDDQVEAAEEILIHSLTQLSELKEQRVFYQPKIFIRVRDVQQIFRLTNRLKNKNSMVTGFIIPKFDLNNADDYIHAIKKINIDCKTPIYMMPILESSTMIPLNTRYNILYSLKSKLDSIENLVINIRVGGNDLCHSFGVRRHNYNTIYEIAPIANILMDIITVFGLDYVVSGPVWEYYNKKGWDTGMQQEIMHDQLNGFIGKTVIHPKQISIVNQAYAVTKVDYQDACSILNWDNSMDTLVLGNSTSERMNEYKTHTNWAKKIVLLSKIYGFKET